MRLGEVCSIRSGYTLRGRPTSVPGGVLTVQTSQLGADGTCSIDRAQGLRIGAPAHAALLLQPGEVVFRARAPHWSAWAPPDDLGEPLLPLAPLFILTPTTDIDAAYLARVLNGPRAQRYFDAEAVGTGVKMIPKRAIDELPLDPLPPPAVQRDLVAAAELADREHRLAVHLAGLRHRQALALIDRATASTNDRKTR